MSVHHDVTVTNKADPDEATGLQAIFLAFFRNPGATIQLALFVAGAFGVYYTLTGNISEVKAASEDHYKNLSLDVAHNYERLSAAMEILKSNDKAEIDRIEQIYQRGDTRYSNIIAKLSAHDVDIAKMVTGMDYIVKVLEDRGGNKQGMILPRHNMPTPVPTIP